MSNKDYIQVKIHKEQIRTQLKKMLSSEHSDLISQVIIDNLSVTEVGLSQLYKSFSGLKDEFKFKVGQKVLVNQSSLHTWRIDYEKMTEAGMIKQGQITCMITKLIKTQENPYTVKYIYLDSSGKEGEDTTDVEESAIFPLDEYPLDQ